MFYLQPTDRKIAKGDLIKIDFGARFAGYHADCTRMFVAGTPANWQQELHALVREGQRQARESLRHGVSTALVDSTARDYFSAHGMSQHFAHGLGHGVGLEIHEDPFFSQSHPTTLDSQTVVTIEPGAYLVDQGGIRIEDTVVVTEDGHTNLTNFPYELITID